MKKLSLIVGLVFFALSLSAQSNKEDLDLIQALYGKDKKELVASFIQLEGAKKDAFWVLYDQYEASRKKLGQKRFALLEKYAAEYETAKDKQMDSLMVRMFTLGRDNDKLIETYYNKMKVKAGYKAAAQFSQIEAYLLSVIRATLLEKIPFFGQLYK